MAQRSRTTPVRDLLLRDVEDADLPILYEHQRDPESSRMADFPPRDWDAFTIHWAKLRADATVTTKAIVADGELVGDLFAWNRDGRRLIGYWIARSHWGRGIASAALARFVASEAARPLYAHVARHNAASLRVLAKCGFTICEESDGEYVLALEAR